jgi:hypothetical protein
VRDADRDHQGTTDLTDVLAVGGALAALGPDPQAEQMLFLGMPAARRMKLDAKSCERALAESHTKSLTSTGAGRMSQAEVISTVERARCRTRWCSPS